MYRKFVVTKIDLPLHLRPLASSLKSGGWMEPIWRRRRCCGWNLSPVLLSTLALLLAPGPHSYSALSYHFCAALLDHFLYRFLFLPSSCFCFMSSNSPLYLQPRLRFSIARLPRLRTNRETDRHPYRKVFISSSPAAVTEPCLIISWWWRWGFNVWIRRCNPLFLCCTKPSRSLV